jgi:hypothetical protein
MSSSRVEYFCSLCDSYRPDGSCGLLPESMQTRQIDGGYCKFSMIGGEVVEIGMQDVRICGQSFKKSSRRLESKLAEMRNGKKYE